MEKGSDKDLVVCGNCKKTFLLDHLTKFIRHKYVHCPPVVSSEKKLDQPRANRCSAANSNCSSSSPCSMKSTNEYSNTGSSFEQYESATSANNPTSIMVPTTNDTTSAGNAAGYFNICDEEETSSRCCLDGCGSGNEPTCSQLKFLNCSRVFGPSQEEEDGENSRKITLQQGFWQSDLDSIVPPKNSNEALALIVGSERQQQPAISDKSLYAFRCDQCDKTYKQKVHLMKHKITQHGGERPYKCSYCPYSAVDKSHLKVHTRKHTGEKPFKCHMCVFQATQNSTLKQHCAIKHAGSLLTCQECGGKFFTSHEIERHHCNVDSNDASSSYMQ